MLRFLEILTWRDLIDVLAVAIIIYNLLLLIRGTRAVQMVLGLLFIGLVYYTALWMELPTLQRILENLLIVLPFAVIVLFQQEIQAAVGGGLVRRDRARRDHPLDPAHRRPDRHRAPARPAQLHRERHPDGRRGLL
jgi:DNA integrity scanning protein DisA with diadenylate cyclase activity